MKEKLLAAHRMGMRNAFSPRITKKDLAEIPAEIQAALSSDSSRIWRGLQIALERPLEPMPHDAVPEVAAKF